MTRPRHRASARLRLRALLARLRAAPSPGGHRAVPRPALEIAERTVGDNPAR